MSSDEVASSNDSGRRDTREEGVERLDRTAATRIAEGTGSPDSSSEWRRAYLKSDEYKKTEKLTDILDTCFFLISVAAITVTIVLVSNDYTWRAWVPVLIPSFAVSWLLYRIARELDRRVEHNFRQTYTGSADELPSRRDDRRTQRRKAAEGDHEPQIPDVWLSDPDLQNLMTLNSAQMKVYHDLTTTQAKRAARNSQIAMALGLIILASGAAIVLSAADVTSKIVVGGLSMIGSAFSGYIGRTFLQAEDRAMWQLNYYFRQPLITSYVLAAERLVLKTDSKEKNELLREIVQQLLRASADAQRVIALGLSTRRPSDHIRRNQATDPEPGSA